MVGGIAAQGKVLMDLGAASHDKQGFISKDLTSDEAQKLSGKAAWAEWEAAGHRSPGMQGALDAEAFNQMQGRMGGIPEADQPLAMYQGMRDLKASKETAEASAKIIADAITKNKPTFTVVNATGGPVTVVEGEGAKRPQQGK